jgi:hypothetical protein
LVQRSVIPSIPGTIILAGTAAGAGTVDLAGTAAGAGTVDLVGTAAGAGIMAGVGTMALAGMAAGAGTMALAGMAAGVGTTALAGMAAGAGTTDIGMDIKTGIGMDTMTLGMELMAGMAFIQDLGLFILRAAAGMVIGEEEKVVLMEMVVLPIILLPGMQIFRGKG